MLKPETIRDLMKACIDWDCKLTFQRAGSGSLEVEISIPKAEITDLPLREVIKFDGWQENDSQWPRDLSVAIANLYAEKRARVPVRGDK